MAIIGNSHVAALNDALKESSNHYKNISFTFFAAPARLAHQVNFLNGIIKPTSEDTLQCYKNTSLGLAYVDIYEFDFIWLYGLTSSLDKYGAWYQNVYCSKNYSSEVKRRTNPERHNCGFRLAKLIAKETKGKGPRLVISPRPMPSSDKFIESSCDINRKQFDQVLTFLNDQASNLNASFLYQTDETLKCDNKFITDPIFSEGSGSLNSKKTNSDKCEKRQGISDRQDYLHMNAIFGNLMLKNFIDLVSKNDGF